MLTKILAGGLIGGIVGGIVVAAIEHVTTVPLILHAEQFEVKDVASAAQILLVHAHDGAVTSSEGGGAMRTVLTFSATILVAVGYTWMLLAAMFAKGAQITARSIIPWAVAGFFVTGLAPALGLAPELPGSSAAPLELRQIWWIGTAVATALGLAAIFFGRGAAWIVGGIVLIALPHLIGAPHPGEMGSLVPAELAAEFTATSLVIQALIWIVPATIAGYAVSRFETAS
jgi:cobalt transporter subunit CbtA